MQSLTEKQQHELSICKDFILALSGKADKEVMKRMIHHSVELACSAGDREKLFVIIEESIVRLGSPTPRKKIYEAIEQIWRSCYDAASGKLEFELALGKTS